VATRDAVIASRYDRIIRLLDGRVVEESLPLPAGDARVTSSHPEHDMTRVPRQESNCHLRFGKPGAI
jgi:hypothetical protein